MIFIDDYKELGYHGIVFIKKDYFPARHRYAAEKSSHEIAALDAAGKAWRFHAWWEEKRNSPIKRRTIGTPVEITSEEYQALAAKHGVDGHSPPSTDPKCPLCGAQMKIRMRRSDRAKFWGCPRYPSCKGTLPIAK